MMLNQLEDKMLLHFLMYRTELFYLQNMPQSHCAFYIGKVATLASAGDS
jgi:hypothetical protein